jgi:hypothetical protein
MSSPSKTSQGHAYIRSIIKRQVQCLSPGTTRTVHNPFPVFREICTTLKKESSKCKFQNFMRSILYVIQFSNDVPFLRSFVVFF